MKGTFKDHFSDASEAYRARRPTYPSQLFEYLASVAPARALAWDCATGNGQSAGPLARHFEAVVATDASAAQIEAAPPTPGVEFRVATAEASGLDPESIDVIAVAQALHWFDLPAFFAEAARVLKPGGILAVWSYQLAIVLPEIDAVVYDLYEPVLGSYWPPERALVATGYEGIALPFEPVASPEFDMSLEWNAEDLCDYLRTWSAAKRYAKERGLDPVDETERRLREIWPDGGDARLRVSWPLRLKVRRKP